MLSLVLLSCALQAQATNTDVSPVGKVIEMVRDLQNQVQSEGTAEAKTYDKFACFCKSKTDEKTGAIEDGQTSVGDLVAHLEVLTSARATLDEEIQRLNDEINGYTTQISEATDLRAGETKTFEAALLDMNKAVSSLERAIAALKASGDSTALIQVQSVQPLVRTGLLMADAMGLGQKLNKKVVSALLQQAPDVPVSDYDFHSGDIISTIEGLLNEFRASRTSLENDNAQSKSDYDLAMQNKHDVLKQAQLSLENAQKNRAKTTEDIATANEDLTATNAVLNDDRVFLKDLTAKCETKAKQWDQRSAMRADELAALTQALAVLESTVAQKAETTGRGRELVQTEESDDDDDDDVAFVQVRRVAGPKGFLQARSPEDQVRDRIVSLLKTAGKSLQSPVLSALATKVGADPFVKIKGLIQELIERLLQEEADEADKKGWCDKEIAAATKDRDYRLRDVNDLHTELESLNARFDKLTQTKSDLEKALAALNLDLETQTTNRGEEKAENEVTVSEAKEGKQAVEQAIDILSHFYGAAAKAEPGALLQGPDDAPDAGFGDEAYTGSQSASGGIMGMLEVIQSDFARSITETEAAEAQAQADFIEFDRETKMSIMKKTTAIEHTTKELTETSESLGENGDDLRTQQGLLDAAVETWEKLMPGCVADPGMSYEERVERRNAEVGALKDAYCILSNEEAGCSGVF